jgi:hypothetical protein
MKRFAIGLVLLFVAGGVGYSAFSTTAGYTGFGNVQLGDDDSTSATEGNLIVGGTATVVGSSTLASVSVTGNTSVNGALISPFDAVSVTSPTATASVAGKTVISLTTNVSQTNFALTGGAQGQVVIVRGTNDSATSTFADGQSSMTLTANAALGLNDTLTLLCTSADGDEWAEVSRALN